ncbi:carbohydrate ABC transporter permease [Cohaesibacter gelatinilyticus]|uniref:Carbohydrate ABC transporter membrane protein 1, CUT1 family n=1 Tax=Cohaesibacter gelatinilyticus TaxID=372072 RepID=A0A285N7B1_9HYPH|nr:sugar ABC transporter permease [Cohaesibacter gelatinilyticus]SNZ05309.1 carbohydrate ABC transporter membrane protein 1, CUT1 family [Cohaesibacter gelatinilyticus]
MRSKISLLGLGFLTPALVMVVLFFLIPVVLTGVFAFTNMSTATGISGGEYLITTNTLKSLKGHDAFDNKVLENLQATTYLVDAAALAKAEKAGVKKPFLKEIESRLSGKSFDSRRAFERALKKLKNRPRKTRELKKAAESFSRSILNQRYALEADFVAALNETGIKLTEVQHNFLVERAYTGWSWTTDNFTAMFKKPATWFVAMNTFIYVSLTLCFNVGFGLLLAITTFYLPSGQAAFFRAVWLLPRISPPVLYVLLWKWFTWDTGFLSSLGSFFGLPAHNYMLGSVGNAWSVVILINGFVGASMGMILFSSAIRAIPTSMLQASEVDGASRWQQVRHIILPQLRWPILFVTSYTTLSLLTSFDYILLSTKGGPGGSTTVWALEAYFTALNNYAGNLEYGYGAAMALVLVTVGITLSLLYLRLFKFDDLVSRPKIEG